MGIAGWRGPKGVGLALLAVVMAASATGCREKTAGGRLTAYGTVEVRQVDVASRVGGKVSQVLVDEGDQVKAGQPLVRFDLPELVAQEDQAKAAVEAAEAQLALLKAGARYQDIQAAEKALSAAQIRQAAAKREVVRVKALVAGKVVASQRLDDASTAVELAESEVAARKAQLSKLRAGARSQQIAAAEAAVGQAKAALEAVKAHLVDQQLDAPTAGIVLHRLTEPGEVARPGAPLLVIGEVARPYLDVYVPEPRIGEAEVGAKVEVHPDAFPQDVLHGLVRNVADEAEFTPKNVQTSDQRARLVFRVRVDVADPEHKLRPGMPAEATFPPKGTQITPPTAPPVKPAPVAAPTEPGGAGASDGGR